MKTFPMFLWVAGRRVVVVGGGEQAAQKVRLVLKTDACVDVVAEALDPELVDLSAAGRIVRVAPDGASVFSDTVLVFVATGCPGADAAWHALAKSAGALVNVVDAPALCDAITPSIVDRDPLVVAIGTEGAAPVLGRRTKARIEEMLEPRLGNLAALAGRLRADVARYIPGAERRAFWNWVFQGAPRQTHARGAEREAAEMIEAAIRDGRVPARSGGLVSIMDPGPGIPDLVTLRGVQRLQEADAIVFPSDLDPGVLDLARRDARRLPVGRQHPEAAPALVVAAAGPGDRVVWITPRDPADAAQAIGALAGRRGGLQIEAVPGVRIPESHAPA